MSQILENKSLLRLIYKFCKVNERIHADKHRSAHLNTSVMSHKHTDKCARLFPAPKHIDFKLVYVYTAHKHKAHIYMYAR